MEKWMKRDSGLLAVYIPAYEIGPPMHPTTLFKRSPKETIYLAPEHNPPGSAGIRGLHPDPIREFSSTGSAGGARRRRELTWANVRKKGVSPLISAQMK